MFAEQSIFAEERKELYEQAVKAGRLALGDSFLEENVGYFWGLIETRPYMRALAGLAECLWKNGQRQEAISHCRELLRLNPNDNQGIRYLLVNYLLAEEMNKEVDELLLEHEEATCFMQYSEALLSFRCKGARKAAGSLRKALELNSHVSAYLLGVKHIPHVVPDAYTRGSEEEAIIYVSVAHQAWEATPNVLAWLAERV
ncbi:Tetratricopeptide repeat protein [compost metagenome]